MFIFCYFQFWKWPCEFPRLKEKFSWNLLFSIIQPVPKYSYIPACGRSPRQILLASDSLSEVIMEMWFCSSICTTSCSLYHRCVHRYTVHEPCQASFPCRRTFPCQNLGKCLPIIYLNVQYPGFWLVPGVLGVIWFLTNLDICDCVMNFCLYSLRN